MSLDKAIKYGKEHRKPYRGAAAWDSHCRNNNYCSWCRDNRTHSDQRREYSNREESLAWEQDHNSQFHVLPADNDPWTWMDQEGPNSVRDSEAGPSWSGLN
jgi:hypothetical protein